MKWSATRWGSSHEAEITETTQVNDKWIISLFLVSFVVVLDFVMIHPYILIPIKSTSSHFLALINGLWLSLLQPRQTKPYWPSYRFVCCVHSIHSFAVLVYFTIIIIAITHFLHYYNIIAFNRPLHHFSLSWTPSTVHNKHCSWPQPHNGRQCMITDTTFYSFSVHPSLCTLFTVDNNYYCWCYCYDCSVIEARNVTHNCNYHSMADAVDRDCGDAVIIRAEPAMYSTFRFVARIWLSALNWNLIFLFLWWNAMCG